MPGHCLLGVDDFQLGKGRVGPQMELSKTRPDSDSFNTDRALQAAQGFETMARADTVGEPPAPPRTLTLGNVRASSSNPLCVQWQVSCELISVILLTESTMIHMAGIKLRPGSKASA